MSDKKKALLILVGGRQTPNLLAAQYWQPDVIIPVASHEALRPHQAWDRIEPVLNTLCDDVREPVEISAFDPQEISKACSNAVATLPDAQWVFNVTCGTAIMSIGAYEAARSCQATAWYLDTATRQVILLTGDVTASAEDVYNVDVTNYMAIYGRHVLTLNESDEELAVATPAECEAARRLVEDPIATQQLLNALRHPDNDGWAMPRSRSHSLRRLCEFLRHKHFLSEADTKSGPIRVKVEPKFYRFLTGDFLEVYAWDAAQRAESKNGYQFYDYRYGLKMPTTEHPDGNEIDLAATYGATLLIAECKTDADPWTGKADYLKGLNDIADMVGGNFVARLFITLQTPPDPNSPNSAVVKKFQAYQAFKQQTIDRQIVLVTGDQLPNLSDILLREVGGIPGQMPTFARF